jgi:RNA-directed DNA polymerase
MAQQTQQQAATTPQAQQPQQDLLTLWRNIQQAGGIPAWVNAQLQARGFLVARRDAKTLSDADLKTYKQQLKIEAVERRKLHKEAWQAYKATHIVHLGDGVFWNDNNAKDKWDLPNAEERQAENELPQLDSAQQLADALGLTIAQLRWLAYHRDAATKVHYYRFTIPKRDGSERPIWAPLPKLKAAQHWILHNIIERLLVHGAVHGFMPGRSILTNAQAHTNSKLVVHMDIKEFFPTVTYPRVRGVFRKAGYREQVATLLALLCTEAPREIVQHDGQQYYIAMGPRCLPQGAPTSPGITNTLCLRMDERITGLARKLGWRYTRYADDMTFSLPANHKGKPRLGALLGLVRRIVEAEGFQVHPDKTRVARKGGRQKVTGLVVNGDQPPRVPRKVRRQIRAAIHNVTHGKPPHEGETHATLVGYAAFVHMTNPKLGSKMLESLNGGNGNGAS